MAGTAAGAVVGGGVLVPLGFVLTDDDDEAPPGATAASLATFPRATVGTVSELAVGEARFVDYPYEGAGNILVKLGERAPGGIGPDHDIVAYSNQCTHMGCPITDYQADSRVLGPCSCHYSTFDLSRDGIVSFGQATQNLPRVLLEIDGDDINAVGVYRLIYGHGDNLTGEGLVAVAEEA